MAFLSPEFIKTVRERADILDVLSRYTDVSKAQRSSANQVIVTSPWKVDERTPSCNVNRAEKVFNDFSSGNGGDVFKLLQLKEGLSFPDAVIAVGAIYGLAPDVRTQENRAKAIRGALHAFQEKARGAAKDNPERVRDLLSHLGVPVQWVDSFKIGYIPKGARFLESHPEGDSLRLGGAAHPAFASDAITLRLLDSNNSIVGFCAHDGVSFTISASHAGFSPKEYLFNLGDRNEPKIFTSPFDALAFAFRNPGASVRATLGLNLTLDTFARASGMKVEQRPDLMATIAAVRAETLEAAETDKG